MKEYLQEKFQEYRDEYLQENCTMQSQMEDYGDTKAVVSHGYCEKDFQAADIFAMDQIELSFDQALKELKQENGFAVSEEEFTETVDAAKLTINKL